MALGILIGLVVTAGLAYALFLGHKHQRRRRLQNLPFPDKWRKILEQNVSLYRRLPGPLRDRLHGLVHVFLAEKNFEGCGGLEITDEIRVTIAAQACILLLGMRAHLYHRLSSILVYPGEFFATRVKDNDRLIENDDPEPFLGESWHTGTVILSWDHAVAGGAHPEDGINLVYHEFAHQLDPANGWTNGAPPLEGRASYAEWARVLEKEYRTLCRRVERGQRTLLDEYATEDAAEFFAVATEYFFERPRQLQSRHPRLYRQLEKFYGQDPASYGG